MKRGVRKVKQEWAIMADGEGIEEEKKENQ